MPEAELNEEGLSAIDVHSADGARLAFLGAVRARVHVFAREQCRCFACIQAHDTVHGAPGLDEFLLVAPGEVRTTAGRRVFTVE